MKWKYLENNWNETLKYSKKFFHFFIKNLVAIGIDMRNSSVLPEVHCFWEMSSNDKLTDHSAFFGRHHRPCCPPGSYFLWRGLLKGKPHPCCGPGIPLVCPSHHACVGNDWTTICRAWSWIWVKTQVFTHIWDASMHPTWSPAAV